MGGEEQPNCGGLNEECPHRFIWLNTWSPAYAVTWIYLGGVAFTTEPVVKENILFSAKNMIMTPHAAAQSREAFINMSMACAKGCLAVVHGEKWAHVVDASAYENKKDT